MRAAKQVPLGCTLGRAQLMWREAPEGENKKLKFSPPVSLALDSPLSEGAFGVRCGIVRRFVGRPALRPPTDDAAGYRWLARRGDPCGCPHKNIAAPGDREGRPYGTFTAPFRASHT